MDTGARPWPWHSVEGQLQLLAGTEGRPPQTRGIVRIGASAHDQERARMGAPESQGPPGQGQGAFGALRGTVVARIPETQRDPGNRSEEHTSELQSLMRKPSDCL